MVAGLQAARCFRPSRAEPAETLSQQPGLFWRERRGGCAEPVTGCLLFEGEEHCGRKPPAQEPLQRPAVYHQRGPAHAHHLFNQHEGNWQGDITKHSPGSPSGPHCPARTRPSLALPDTAYSCPRTVGRCPVLFPASPSLCRSTPGPLPACWEPPSFAAEADTVLQEGCAVQWLSPQPGSQATLVTTLPWP